MLNEQLNCNEILTECVLDNVLDSSLYIQYIYKIRSINIYSTRETLQTWSTCQWPFLIQEDTHGIHHPLASSLISLITISWTIALFRRNPLTFCLLTNILRFNIGASSDPVTSFTDHNPLVFWFCMSKSTQQLRWWSLIVQRFNINIQHKKVTENVVVDSLFRCHFSESCEPEVQS